MKHVMLLGAGGQVGREISRCPLPADWRLDCYTHAQLDMTDHDAVRQAVREQRPDLIINAAAMTDILQAEQNELLATQINFFATANLAALCSTNDIPLIHLSTDFVFDGRHDTPYLPDDQMNPINIYGKTKLLGEEAVRQELPWHVILRTSSVFSPYGRNVATEMLGGIDEQNELRYAENVQTCPTYAGDLAAALVTVAAAILNGKIDGYGTFHLCGSPATTLYDFAQALMEAYALHTDKRPQILPTPQADLSQPMERPLYSVLDCSKIGKVYGIKQTPWKDRLSEVVSNWVKSK